MKHLPLILLVLLFACATTGKLARLNIGMEKPGVIQTMGEPDAVRGSITNRHGQVIEVWEYELQKKDSRNPWTGASPATYWLFFADGRLARWGEAGDWRRESDRIYEVRF